MPDPNLTALTPQQPFIGAIPQNQQQYPVQQVQAPAASSGGLVNKYGLIQQAAANDQNMANQRAQMDRAAIDFKEQQAKSKAAGDVGTPETPVTPPPGEHSATGDGHADFMGAILQGLHSIGTGVHNLFGGGAPAQGAIPAPQGPPAPAAAPQMQGPPAPAPAGVPMQGPPSPVQSQMHGGVVQGGNQPPPAFLQGPTAGDPGPHVQIMAFQEGGAVPAYGVMDGGVSGLRGFADGGAIPMEGPPAPAAAPAQAAPTGDVDVPVSPAHARSEMTRAIVDAHQILDDHTLNDQDVPKHSQAIPVETITPTEATNRQRSGGFAADGTPAAPAAAVDTQAPTAPPGSSPAAQAATNQAGTQASPAAPASPAGSPDPKVAAAGSAASNAAQSTDAQAGDPGPATQKHSITPEQWDAFEQRKEYAIKMAAYAGQDPGQVRAAMDANRNAWVQGGVLKYLATANAAAIKGDQGGVQKALHNAFYYMPDGNELNFDKKGPNGQLQYQDPINPYVDAKTQAPVSGPHVPGAVPNMVPVDTRHIQMLGQAMLDPMNVQNTINNVRSAQAQIGLAQARGQAALMVGSGRQMAGEAALGNAGTHASLAPSEITKNNAEAYNRIATADAYRQKMLQDPKTPNIDPTIARQATLAADDTEKQIAGALAPTPLQIPDPKHPGQMMANMDPNAGKMTRDPNKSALPNATPQEIMNAKGLTSNIYAAAGGKIGTAEASRLGILGIAAQRKGATHPENGKPAANFHLDVDGTAHIWNPATHRYEVTKVTPEAAESVRGGGDFSVEPPPPAASGGSGIPTTASAEPENADENAVLDGSKDGE